jgi:hypothetical protein
MTDARLICAPVIVPNRMAPTDRVRSASDDAAAGDSALLTL